MSKKIHETKDYLEELKFGNVGNPFRRCLVKISRKQFTIITVVTCCVTTVVSNLRIKLEKLVFEVLQMSYITDTDPNLTICIPGALV